MAEGIEFRPERGEGLTRNLFWRLRFYATLPQGEAARRLSEAAGRRIARQTVSDWERGASQPPRDAVEAYRETFATEIERVRAAVRAELAAA